MAELPFGEISGTPAGILILRVLKAERAGKLLGAEVWDEALIQDAPGIFEAILRYQGIWFEMSLDGGDVKDEVDGFGWVALVNLEPTR